MSNGPLPQPSPLPPEPTPSLVSLDAKVNHLIGEVEYMRRHEEAFDDRLASVENLQKSLHKTSLNLSGITLNLSATAANLASVKNPVSLKARIATIGLGSLLGGFLAQVVFFFLPKLFH